MRQRVFLLGGMNSKTKKISNAVFEVRLTKSSSGKSSNLIKKKAMLTPKLSFAYCIGENASMVNGVETWKQYIFTIGGQNVSRIATDSCERYDIANDVWTQLPVLKEACYSASCIQTDGNQLFVVGGFNAQNNLIKTIQYLDLEDEANDWVIIAPKLKQPMCNVGLQQFKQARILIFGGWKE